MQNAGKNTVKDTHSKTSHSKAKEKIYMVGFFSGKRIKLKKTDRYPLEELKILYDQTSLLIIYNSNGEKSPSDKNCYSKMF